MKTITFEEFSGGLEFGQDAHNVDGGQKQRYFKYPAEPLKVVFRTPNHSEQSCVCMNVNDGFVPVMTRISLEHESGRLYSNTWRLDFFVNDTGVDPLASNPTGDARYNVKRGRYWLRPDTMYALVLEPPFNSPETTLSMKYLGSDINEVEYAPVAEDGDPKEFTFDGVDYLAFPAG